MDVKKEEELGKGGRGKNFPRNNHEAKPSLCLFVWVGGLVGKFRELARLGSQPASQPVSQLFGKRLFVMLKILHKLF